MRIALLWHGSPPRAGGDDRLATEVLGHARALAELGHDVSVFAAGAPAGAQSRSGDGIRVTPVDPSALPPRLAADAFAALRRGLDDGGFDVVELIGDATVAGLAAMCDDLPVVVRCEGVGAFDEDAIERSAAARLARLGLRAARAVSTPTGWVRRELERRGVLDRTAWVVPDGVARADSVSSGFRAGAGLPADAPLLACVGVPERHADDLVGLLRSALEAHPALWVATLGRPGGAVGIEGLPGRIGVARDRVVAVPAADETTLRSALGEADIGLFWLDAAPTPPADLLLGMAAGTALLVADVESVGEVVRRGVDGLLFDAADDALSAVRTMLGNAGLRERLGRSAAQRAQERFDPRRLALRRLETYALASPRWDVSPGAAPDEDAALLGPDDWFDSWWLRRAAATPTRLRRDADGRPQLLALGIDELRTVEAVLVRGWCDGPADWQAPEWHELRDLSARVLERLEELRSGAEAAEAGARMAFPPDDHPMFEPDQPGVLLAEAWRLGASDAFARWCAGVVRARGFAARAVENVNLRRIAVEAAVRAPNVSIYDVLRRTYRNAGRHARVVAGDRDLLDHGRGVDAFANGIAALGLHATLERQRFPRGRRRSAADSSAAPRVTVVIPSYRHVAYVAAAIESCLRQSIGDVKVLVVDDQSPDGTVEVARRLDDPRVQVDVNERNLGLGGSVLGALARVDTPFVALLNSDDLFHPRRLERCLRVLERDADAALVATRFAVVDRAGAVLTDQSSCAVEIGPQARDWLRWFEGIVRDELKRPGDWTSFERLLRHNVLVTSSNMVFRTDWLREHMPEACQLEYCVDWQLFLQAAMEEALRFVPEPLLAYRLHDANTVWFRGGGRAGYVMEVNGVVDRVLGQWLERVVERHGDADAVERLAALLERDVLQHGETDGLALYLVDLARRLAGGRIDPDARPVAELAAAALRRSTLRIVGSQLDVDPWSLPWRSRRADQWGIEHDVAERSQSRVRELGEENVRFRLTLQERRQEVQDADARAARAESALAERERAFAQRLEELRERAEQARRDHEAALAAEKRARAEAEDGERRTAVELERARAEVERASRNLAELERNLAASRDETGRVRAEARLRAAVGDRAMLALLAARDEAERRNAAPEWQLGATLLRGTLPRGVHKTLTGVARRTGARLRRIGWHAGRVLRADGRSRQRFVVFADEVAGDGATSRAIRAASRLAARGAFAIGWNPLGAPDEFRAAAGALRTAGRAAIWLVDDSRLAALDRRYFERRVPRGVDELVALLGEDHPWLGRAFRSARVARALGAGVGVAYGVGAGAVEAHACRVLAGIPTVLVVGDEDLALSTLPEGVCDRIVAATDLLAVDSAAVGDALERRAGPHPHRVEHDGLPPPDAPSPDRSGSDELRVLVPFGSGHRADPATLVWAIRASVEQGVAPRVEVYGRPAHALGAQRAWFELEAMVVAAGLADRFIWNRGPTMPPLETVDVVLWVGRDADGLGVPRVVRDALAAGRPVVASAVGPLRAAPAIPDLAVLVEPEDADALAAALTRCAREGVGVDAAPRERLLAAWRDAAAAFETACQRLTDSEPRNP